MSGASSWDDGRKMNSILKAMSSASSCDDCCKMDSILKAMSSASSCDDCRKMHKGRRLSSVEGADKGGEISLKKGPWTQEEDAILKEYVKKHGEGNWNAVQKYSGLARCGKSCRLRWTNHLKPNLKKGAFTAEEEQRVVELHASMGNKWSKMAAQLPGRTDNDIKNFWNTRVKRRQRAGQTTYPEVVEIYRQQVPNGNQENLNPDAALTNEAGQDDSISQTESCDIPDVEFKRLKLPPCIYDPSIYMPMTVSDMLPQQCNMLPVMHPSVSDMLADLEQSTYSSPYNMLPMMHPSKRLRGSDMIYNSFDPSAVPAFDQYDTSDPRLLSRYDPIFNTSNKFGNILTGSHAGLNGTISASSDPIYGAFKVDLPSVQNFEAQKHIWHTPESSLPPLESVDTPDSSIQFQPNQSAPVTHQNNDGLLESIFYGSKNSNGSSNVDSFQQNNDHFVPYEANQNSILNSNGSNNVNSFQQNNDHFIPYEAIQNSNSNSWNNVDSFQQNNDHFVPYEAIQNSILNSNGSNNVNSFQQNNDHFIPYEAIQNSNSNSWNNVDSFQQNNDHFVPYEAIQNSTLSSNGSNNVDSFQQNNDNFVPNEAIQNSTLNPSETQLDEQEDLRSSLGPFSASALADYTIIATQGDGDKHGTSTEFPADSPSQESQNLLEYLLDPDPAPDLSFMESYYINGDS